MNPTPATPPTPLQVHHSWMQILWQVLAVTAAVAPAAAAPFVPPATEQIIATEAGIASGIAGALAQQS